ncbi:MAG: DUF2339 domain-containing protein, partial [Myxococcota bacterium]|nr:DUF2339 domain-containing protein [Myxococcota bacterium]
AALLGALIVTVAPGVPPIAGIGAIALLGLLALFAASREGGPGLAVAAIVVTAIALPRFAFEPGDATTDALRLAMVGAITLVFTAWPALVPRLASTSWGWRASALAAPLSFLTLRHLWLETLGARYVGALPLILALVSLGFATLASRRSAIDPAVKRVALVWLAAVTAGFVTLAIPLQLDREWWTIGWALEGAALLALDRRLDHPGLKYLALGLFGAVSLRLIANPYVLQYYPRSELRIFNWLTYTYLVPALSMLVGSRLLADVEVARRRAWERVVELQQPYLASLLFSAFLVVVFAWVNLTIFDWFATGPELTIPLERMPARDLAISIAWAVYALGLLALGMWRDSTAMRVTSLGLILVTAAKVFLYDLGHLRDLYRVGALVGLALTLILVSIAYQRFVFGKRAREVA